MTCTGCGGPLPGQARKWCSGACRQRWLRAQDPEAARAKAREEQRRKRARRGPKAPVELVCAECGVAFVGRPNRRWCSAACTNRVTRRRRIERAGSEEWARRQREYRMARRAAQNPVPQSESEARTTYKRRRRAWLAATWSGERITVAVVGERDEWTCQVCSEPVDQALRFPDPKSKSIDHVVPLHAGGTHDLANVQLAHLGCNSSKGTRLLAG